MARWYIIHAYSGFENKVKESILSEAERMGLSQLVEQVDRTNTKRPGQALGGAGEPDEEEVQEVEAAGVHIRDHVPDVLAQLLVEQRRAAARQPGLHRRHAVEQSHLLAVEGCLHQLLRVLEVVESEVQRVLDRKRRIRIRPLPPCPQQDRSHLGRNAVQVLWLRRLPSSSGAQKQVTQRRPSPCIFMSSTGVATRVIRMSGRSPAAQWQRQVFTKIGTLLS